MVVFMHAPSVDELSLISYPSICTLMSVFAAVWNQRCLWDAGRIQQMTEATAWLFMFQLVEAITS